MIILKEAKHTNICVTSSVIVGGGNGEYSTFDWFDEFDIFAWIIFVALYIKIAKKNVYG